MKEANAKVAEAYALGQRFTDMIQERQFEALLPCCLENHKIYHLIDCQ